MGSNTIQSPIKLIEVWVSNTGDKWRPRWAAHCMIDSNSAFNHGDHRTADVLTVIKKGVISWDNITTEDPFTPKVPEWMPEGCELVEKGEDGCGIIVYGEYGTSPEIRKNFHSFAVQAGDGTVWLPKTPNHFTKEDSSKLLTYYVEGDIDAKILGCVMRKAVSR